MGIIRISARARKDLGDIWVYVADESSPEAADRLLSRIEATAELLASMPRMGRPRKQLQEGLRSWPVGEYQILYFPLPDGIHIVRVIHTRRDINSLFQ